MKYYLVSLLLLVFLWSCSPEPQKIDLSGEWTVKLDSANVGLEQNWAGKLYSTSISLPGTLDDARLGNPDTLKPELTKSQLLHLTRAYSYVGPAWYSRTISVPENWTGKKVVLYLERILWDSQVWIDGNKVEGHEESLTTPHRYDLTAYVVPGKEHVLTIRVDNSYRHDISVADNLAHAYTDHTQIKWNGILGDMSLLCEENVSIRNIQLFPDVDNKAVKLVLHTENDTESPVTATMTVSVKNKATGKLVSTSAETIEIGVGDGTSEYTCAVENAELWSEHNPVLYTATVDIKAGELSLSKTASFGMRKIEHQGPQMLLNGQPLFLRGTLECCIFPLTGTPPMDKAGWEKVFKAAKEYGLNHLRFHSWCPPHAAFEVADEMGFYLQVELPVWATNLGTDPGAVKFIQDEAQRIMVEYGNHPSFCMWSLGNELEGDFGMLTELLVSLKKADNRHLYTTTSFTFAKGHGVWPEENDDFFVSQWTNKGWVRGQGVFNQQSPSFDKDYSRAIEGMTVPLITHEIGQYSVYPDLKEIEKYTGVLKPTNFIAVKNDLEKKGLLGKADAYTMASGKLAAILYKEEIERALKTAGISGFQLLDLHDFPGQGTALVGLLNAFWESKGIITGAEFREFCSPVVPLLKFPKAVYTNDETFEAELELCNYGAGELSDKTFTWTVYNGSEKLAEGQIPMKKAAIGYNGALGHVKFPLNGIAKAARLQVVVSMNDTEYKNRWNIWVYPKQLNVEFGNVVYTRSFAQAKSLLAEGKSVLFNPDWKKMKGIEGKFVPVFWSPVHFPKQAGTMGVLCDPTHEALADFPTDSHSDWQWWDLNINSTTLIVDSIKGGAPIVEMIDNFANNRRLTSLYEGSVGKGKLVIATFDLNTDLEKRPVAKQMLVSVLNYMNSKEFNPLAIENIDVLAPAFGTGTASKDSATGIYE